MAVVVLQFEGDPTNPSRLLKSLAAAEDKLIQGSARDDKLTSLSIVELIHKRVNVLAIESPITTLWKDAVKQTLHFGFRGGSDGFSEILIVKPALELVPELS